jgi:hypothetical protein
MTHRLIMLSSALTTFLISVPTRIRIGPGFFSSDSRRLFKTSPCSLELAGAANAACSAESGSNGVLAIASDDEVEGPEQGTVGVGIPTPWTLFGQVMVRAILRRQSRLLTLLHSRRNNRKEYKPSSRLRKRLPRSFSKLVNVRLSCHCPHLLSLIRSIHLQIVSRG